MSKISDVEYLSRYSANEISKVLCELAMENPDAGIIAECDEAIYYLKTIAENPYNKEHFRTLFRVLEILTHKHEDIIFKEE